MFMNPNFIHNTNDRLLKQIKNASSHASRVKG